MKGKQRCKILKEIRRQIAQNNDIEFITSECKHQRDCLGTCPKCEAEVRYLERELEKRQRLGKAVTIAGLAVTLSASAAGCMLPADQLDGDMLASTADSQNIADTEETDIVYDGDMVIKGEMVDIPGGISEETTYTTELMGEPAYIPEAFDELEAMSDDYIKDTLLRFYSFAFYEEQWKNNITYSDSEKCIMSNSNGFTLTLIKGDLMFEDVMITRPSEDSTVEASESEQK